MAPGVAGAGRKRIAKHKLARGTRGTVDQAQAHRSKDLALGTEHGALDAQPVDHRTVAARAALLRLDEELLRSAAIAAEAATRILLAMLRAEIEHLHRIRAAAEFEGNPALCVARRFAWGKHIMPRDAHLPLYELRFALHAPSAALAGAPVHAAQVEPGVVLVADVANAVAVMVALVAVVAVRAVVVGCAYAIHIVVGSTVDGHTAICLEATTGTGPHRTIRIAQRFREHRTLRAAGFEFFDAAAELRIATRRFKTAPLARLRAGFLLHRDADTGLADTHLRTLILTTRTKGLVMLLARDAAAGLHITAEALHALARHRAIVIGLANVLDLREEDVGGFVGVLHHQVGGRTLERHDRTIVR